MEREILENGTIVRQTVEGDWVANVALEEYNPDQERYPWQNTPAEKKYTFIQANGKTKSEALISLNKMVWDMISKTNKEIDVLESRRVKLTMWLDGKVKGEVFD